MNEFKYFYLPQSFLVHTLKPENVSLVSSLEDWKKKKNNFTSIFQGFVLHDIKFFINCA